jgi:hypothetical protein
MIKGLHGLFFSTDPVATRKFLRDQLGLPFSDIGEGWLIFDMREGDLGVHPLREGGGPAPGTHLVSFYCDNIRSTVAELRARGVEFEGRIKDRGFGFVTTIKIPGGVEVDLYQPKYRKTTAPRAARTSRRRPRAARRAPAGRSRRGR